MNRTLQVPAQLFYNWRESTGWMSGEELHDFFATHYGHRSPRGRATIPVSAFGEEIFSQAMLEASSSKNFLKAVQDYNSEMVKEEVEKLRVEIWKFFGLQLIVYLSVDFEGWKPEMGTIMFPESGISPANVLKFADEAIEMSLKGDVKIATYSELLFLRIRRRMAEGYISPDRVKIMFLNSKKETEEVRLNSRGEYKNSPKEFKEVFADIIEEVLAMTDAKLN